MQKRLSVPSRSSSTGFHELREVREPALSEFAPLVERDDKHSAGGASRRRAVGERAAGAGQALANCGTGSSGRSRGRVPPRAPGASPSAQESSATGTRVTKYFVGNRRRCQP